MARDQLLALIDLAEGRGLEIGALTKPIVTRSMGRIEYIDRASTEDLRRWYANQGHVDPAELVEVDHVWGTQTLLDCVGGQRVFNYLVASHVIEHVPDLFGWLGEIASVLSDGGIASFAVPDKRFTYDVRRRTSSESELVDAYVRKLRRPDPRQIFDHFIGFTNPDGTPSQHDPRALMEDCRRVLAEGTYIDSHCWVFTPRTFVEALDLGSRLGLLPFEIGAIFPTTPPSNEFFVSLRRLPEALTTEQQRAAFVASRDRVDLPAEDTESEVEGLKQRLAAAESELAALRGSTSWRITAPLRRAISLLRRSG